MSELHERNEIILKQGKPSLFGMFLYPGEQFEKLKAKPLIFVPLLLVTLIYTLGTAIMAFGMDSSWLLVQISPEEADLFAEMEIFMRIGILFFGLFIPIISALLFAIVFIIIAKISRSAVTFKQLFSLGIFVSVIGGIGVLFNAIMTTFFGTNPDIPFTSLALFFGEESALLIGIEVFSIWQLIVTVTGLRKVANFDAVLAWIATIVFYVISIIIALLIS
ncbi:hypothetical protein BKP45_02950 [Anaerobacillus alkalidiazotrophicus]|uniref:Yip1 domain-containing protein n=1 Tax=Anaerobacillus alkalidiazotrophicus TaxID=472963 RepID=A0A1S2MAV0_9BACI|nr:YIP1 family protein [Anaerobacillus alkalidiazotrophicus]OIJ21694.1 hypothetical protein BKP45_02950 [Anaerobacillus alkalidiazotrophicus]